MDLPWLSDLTDSWRSQTTQGRMPHAVLLQGPAGVGKRCAAAWMLSDFLGLEADNSKPVYPLQLPEHADFRRVCMPEDKKSIGVDQIRGLVAELQLTSYEGGGKGALIDPADAMTVNAANSLLKTLEEPPGSSLLILVADGPARLPSTILSRCQRINIPAPAEAVSLAWLDTLRPATQWPAALAVAGMAPLGAIEALEQLPVVDEMARDLAAIAERRAAPLEVAARWAKLEQGFVLDWLCREVQNTIYWTGGGGRHANGAQPADSVLRRIDRRNLFCYLDIINRLRSQGAGSFNVQLALESLLIDWAEGLSGCTASAIAGPLGTR